MCSNGDTNIFRRIQPRIQYKLWPIFENPNLLPFFAQGPLVPDVKYWYLVGVCAHGEKNVLLGFCNEAPEMFRVPEP